MEAASLSSRTDDSGPSPPPTGFRTMSSGLSPRTARAISGWLRRKGWCAILMGCSRDSRPGDPINKLYQDPHGEVWAVRGKRITKLHNGAFEEVSVEGGGPGLGG